MANPNPSPATRFTSENRPQGGRPKGSRDKLSQEFLSDLVAVYAENGKAALEHVAKNDQATFFKALIALQPKEFEVKTPESELTDEQIEQAYAELLARLASRRKDEQPQAPVN